MLKFLKWLGIHDRNHRYGPRYYEIIFSQTGGVAHTLRVNVFYIRRFLMVMGLVVLSSLIWLGYLSYSHYKLQNDIAELEATKQKMRQLALQKREQDIRQEVMAGDYFKLATRVYDLEQQVTKIKQRDIQIGRLGVAIPKPIMTDPKKVSSLTPAKTMPTTNVSQSENLINGMGGEFPSSATVWEITKASTSLSYLETWIDELLQIPRGMPVPPETTRLSSPFGYRNNPFTNQGSEFHSGLDFASKAGTPIYATAKGKVLVAGWAGGLGQSVKIDHGDGYMTNFGHMSKVLVNVGSEVEAGDIVGLVGSTGRSSGPHLHYMVYYQNKLIDPYTYVK